MESLPIQIFFYADASGDLPFERWFGSLRDRTAQVRIVRVLDRIREGNLTDHKGLGGGLSEIRIDVGPGYRLYYTREGSTIIVLLAGGDKSSQNKDIILARHRLADFRERRNKGA